jgi:hypothetical protein
MESNDSGRSTDADMNDVEDDGLSAGMIDVGTSSPIFDDAPSDIVDVDMGAGEQGATPGDDLVDAGSRARVVEDTALRYGVLETIVSRQADQRRDAEPLVDDYLRVRGREDIELSRRARWVRMGCRRVRQLMDRAMRQCLRRRRENEDAAALEERAAELAEERGGPVTRRRHRQDVSVALPPHRWGSCS